MAGKVFLDSNLFVYAQGEAWPEKKAKARETITALAGDGIGVLSTQVMQEFYVAVTRKLGVEPLAAKAMIKTFSIFEIIQITPDLIGEAVDCSILDQLSFWDALIVSAAAATGCKDLYSEDLSNGQMIRGVRIVNPFADIHETAGK